MDGCRCCYECHYIKFHVHGEMGKEKPAIFRAGTHRLRVACFLGGRECPGLSQAPHPVHIAQTDYAQTARPADRADKEQQSGPSTGSQRPDITVAQQRRADPCSAVHRWRTRAAPRQLPLKNYHLCNRPHIKEREVSWVCATHIGPSTHKLQDTKSYTPERPSLNQKLAIPTSS